MAIKLEQKYLIILAVCTLLWNQQTNFLAHKVAIEKSYQEKIVSAISRLVGYDQFLVIVNIEFSTVGGILKNTSEQQANKNAANGYNPFPGLPTVPSSQNATALYAGQKNISGNNYNIGRVDVTIGLNETSFISSVKPDIISLIKKIIPETKDCDDCIKIEQMKFQANQKNEKLKELEKAIAILEKAKRNADIATDSIRLDNLETQLTDAQNARKTLETIATRRELQNQREDSIRFVQLLESEKVRKKQDSLRFVNTEKRLERVMESKIKSDSVIISETMGIVKQQVTLDKDNQGSVLGMQLGSNGSGILNTIFIIFLIICLIIVTFLAASNKKPKTVYLKPKEQSKKKLSLMKN